MAKAFISYVRDNRTEIERLVADLSSSGVDVWIDTKKLLPGHRWSDTIRRAISDGDYFIACFSKEYSERSKSYMNEELALAIDELRQRPTDNAWFIPVKLTVCEIPDRKIGGGETLRDLQWVALYEDWQDGLNRILSVIRPSAPKLQVDAHLVRVFIHSITQPLVGIWGYTSNLRDGIYERDSNRKAEVLDIIDSMSGIALYLAQNLRASIYLFQPDPKLFYSKINLREEVVRTRKLLTPLARSAEIDITFRGLELVPRHFKGDATLIAQLFFILLHNAILYSGHPRDGKSESNRITRDILVDFSSSATDQIVIRVRNCGIPIDKEETRRIFEMGYRSKAAQVYAPSGSGFGLFLAKRIVELHGGRIEYVAIQEQSIHEFCVILPVLFRRTMT